MKKYLGAVLLCVLFFGFAACQPAIITSAKWDSANTVQTRCERIDMRNKAEMDSIFTKYDGWKLVYLSEYTTSNKTGTDAAVCFAK